MTIRELTAYQVVCDHCGGTAYDMDAEYPLSDDAGDAKDRDHWRDKKDEQFLADAPIGEAFHIGVGGAVAAWSAKQAEHGASRHCAIGATDVFLRGIYAKKAQNRQALFFTKILYPINTE